MKKYYITTPIYYVNDVPHIGHAYTTVGADILARYYRLKLGGKNVYFLTGTDEHGTKIEQSAQKNNETEQEYCDKISAQFQLAWDSLAISNNDFIRTTDAKHEETVKFIFEKLKQTNGPSGEPVLYKGTYEGLYCTGCEAFKTADEIEDNKCPLHPTYELSHLKEDNWFFRLSDFQDILKEKISTDEIKVMPQSRKNEVMAMVEGGLQDIAFSRANVDWGIRVPFDPDQTVYVWVDALLNYISALDYKKDDKKFKDFWPADVHLMAKDILKFHAIIWPAILIAIGLKTPKKVFAHGFFTVDGQKMSKSIGNVIDPNRLVADYGCDGARHLIISQYAFGNDGDIKAEDFDTKFNADLANGLGNLVSRVLGMTEKYFDSKVPQGKYNAEFDLAKFWQEYDEGFENLKLYENNQLLQKAISWCDSYIDENKPWELAKTDTDKLAEIIYNLIEIIAHLSFAILPYYPETSPKIWAKLNLQKADKMTFKQMQKIGQIKSGAKVEKGEPLFLRK